MRVGICQFAPQLRDVEGNIRRADSFLEHVRPGDLDLLVLPELALTGYNFASLADITPFLEPTAAGVSATWARKTAARLQCLVTVGYPEISQEPVGSEPGLRDHQSFSSQDNREGTEETDPSWPRSRTYNALITVNPEGELVAHYRKSNLFYTDASWSWPNPDSYGSKAIELPLVLFPNTDKQSSSTPTAFGICMDFNPKQFTAPWEDYELATNIRRTNARLLIASNAWLTHKSLLELQAEPDAYDPETLSYWVQRLKPLIDSGGGWDKNVRTSTGIKTSATATSVPDDSTSHNGANTSSSSSEPVEKAPAMQLGAGRSTERIFVIANRVGCEDGEVRACDLTRGRPPFPGEPDPVWTSIEEARKQAAREQDLSGVVGAEPMISAPDKDSQDKKSEDAAAREARYAGSSCVFGLRGDGRIRMYGALGRAREKLLVVDTDAEPEWVGALRSPE